MKNKLVARCGLYCGACDIYRAGIDEPKLAETIAKYNGWEPGLIKCGGCIAPDNNCWSNDCKITSCLAGKGFEFCFDCQKFDDSSCEWLEDVASRYKKYTGMDTKANLLCIKEIGQDAWIAQMDAKHRCPDCGKPIPASFKFCWSCREKSQK